MVADLQDVYQSVPNNYYGGQKLYIHEQLFSELSSYFETHLLNEISFVNYFIFTRECGQCAAAL